MSPKKKAGEDKLRVLYEGQAGVNEGDELTEDEVLQESFDGSLGDDGFDPMIVRDKDGKVYKVNVKFVFNQITGDDLEDELRKLSMCTKHMVRNCEEC